MRPFREFRVGEAAHRFALQVYAETRRFPPEERFGLTNQMRRAAVSIPSNIAEGSARGDTEFRQFLRIALGSAAELEYQLLLSRDLGYLNESAYSALDSELASIKRMLVTFMKTLKTETPGVGRANGQRPIANRQQPGSPS